MAMDSSSTLGGMEHKLREAFVRVRAGEWFCRAPVVIHGPAGAVHATPGVSYMKGRLFSGFDIAGMLDAWHETAALPPNVRVE